MISKKHKTAAQRIAARTRRTRELILFSLLGGILFISKILMEAAPPNMHLAAVLIVTYTLVYRARALVPIYVFVFLFGLYYGFSSWWLGYLYIWAVLWGFAMLIPKKLPEGVKIPVCMAVCGLHGILFGLLYAPVQALLFKFSFKETLVWVAAGFSFDVMHAVYNFFLGALAVPLAAALAGMERKSKNLRM